MSNGWVYLHRQIYNNWVWEDKPFSKGQAWIDIILMVNHKTRKVFFRNELLEVKRGQRVTSEVKLADRWGWSRTKVRNFLEMLEEDNMIKVHKKNKRRTRLEVCNYNEYQTIKKKKKTTEKQQENNRKTTEKQQKNINNELELMTTNDNKKNNNLSDKSDEQFPVLSKLPKENSHYQYPDKFEELWQEYPKRKGGNPKGDGYKKFRARINEGAKFDDLLKAVKNYKKYCQAENNINTRYVKQAKGFFGNGGYWKEYLEYKKTNRKVAADF